MKRLVCVSAAAAAVALLLAAPAGATIPVTPVVDCVSVDPVTGNDTVYFGYSNTGTQQYFIPVGDANSVSPGVPFQGQPEAFNIGFYPRIFLSTYNPGIFASDNWFLNGLVATAFPAAADSPQLCSSGVVAPPTAVTSTSATMNGVVAAEGTSATYHFDYGPTTAYGSSTPDATVSNGGYAQLNQLVQAPLPALQPATPYHYRLVVTDGNGTTASADESFTTPPGPQTERAPAVIGSPVVGNVLTLDQGAYSGDPAPTVTVQWQAFDSGTATWLPDGTGLRHRVSSSDGTRRLRVEITADNGDGAPLTVDSAPTAPVLGPQTAAPVITGAAVSGQTLTLTPGSWQSADAQTVTEQWQRCTSQGCAKVHGATGLTYQLGPADVGGYLRALVTYATDGVSVGVTTLNTGQVAPAP